MPRSKWSDSWSNLNLGMLFNSEKRQETYVEFSTQGEGGCNSGTLFQTNKKYVHIGCIWLGNPDLDFEIQILDFAIKCESKNGFHLSRFQLRNPNQDLMDFLFTVRWWNLKKAIAKLF